MNITVNGRKQTIDNIKNLQDLLNHFFINTLQKREKKTNFSADPNLVSRNGGILGCGRRPLFEKDEGIIVELNQEIIHRDQWKEQPVKEGDVIELIQFIGGG